MNERIRQLAEQCWEERKYGPSWFNQEKFAQLIVRECAELVDRAISDGGVDGRMVKEHFGIE